MAEPFHVGPAVKLIRTEKHKWTQEQLAEKVGMNRLSISQIEQNRRGISPTRLRELAEALEVPVSYLFLLADDSDDELVKRFQEVARKSLRLASPKHSVRLASAK